MNKYIKWSIRVVVQFLNTLLIIVLCYYNSYYLLAYGAESQKGYIYGQRNVTIPLSNSEFISLEVVFGYYSSINSVEVLTTNIDSDYNGLYVQKSSLGKIETKFDFIYNRTDVIRLEITNKAEDKNQELTIYYFPIHFSSEILITDDNLYAINGCDVEFISLQKNEIVLSSDNRVLTLSIPKNKNEDGFSIFYDTLEIKSNCLLDRRAVHYQKILDHIKL